MSMQPTRYEHEWEEQRDEADTLHQQVASLTEERDRLREHFDKCGSCFALTELSRRAEKAEALLRERDEQIERLRTERACSTCSYLDPVSHELRIVSHAVGESCPQVAPQEQR